VVRVIKHHHPRARRRWQMRSERDSTSVSSRRRRSSTLTKQRRMRSKLELGAGCAEAKRGRTWVSPCAWGIGGHGIAKEGSGQCKYEQGSQRTRCRKPPSQEAVSLCSSITWHRRRHSAGFRFKNAPERGRDQGAADGCTRAMHGASRDPGDPPLSRPPLSVTSSTSAFTTHSGAARPPRKRPQGGRRAKRQHRALALGCCATAFFDDLYDPDFGSDDVFDNPYGDWLDFG
jgi:hypothetical protein